MLITSRDCAGRICAIKGRDLIVSEDFRGRRRRGMYVTFVGINWHILVDLVRDDEV